MDSQTTKNDNGFALLPIIGFLAIMTIMAAMVGPNLVTLLHFQSGDQEDHELDAIGQGTARYLRSNRAWPANIAALSPDYVTLDSTTISVNSGGFPRYYVIHPTTSGFSNGTGVSTNQIPDLRFLLISNLRADAAPTITNASEFQTWWTTDETATMDLHITRGNSAHLFHQVHVMAMGDGGSFQIDGTSTNSGGTTLTEYMNYHAVGTVVGLDEDDIYVTPDIQFVLTKDIFYTFDPCQQAGQKWSLPPVPSCSTITTVFWLTTEHASSGAPGLSSWTGGDIVQFHEPNLTYESGPTGTTSGTFRPIFTIQDFTTAGEVDVIHYVTQAITVGQTTTVDLEEGDLLLSLPTSDTLVSINTLAVTDDDVFIFRPSSSGVYTSGNFYRLLDGSDLGISDVKALSLVEQTTVVGGVSLSAGTFLISDSGEEDLYHFIPDRVGSTTTGTYQLFLDGSDININPGNNHIGIELVEATTTIGDVTLQVGQLVSTLSHSDSSVGNNSIDTDDQDLILFDVTTAGTDTVANATMLFDGSDVDLQDGDEELEGNTLVPYFETFRDKFLTIAFNGYDGTLAWSNDWQEIGESDGPTDGIVEVDTSDDCASGNCIRIRGRDDEDLNGVGLSREADLTGATTATLTFSYMRGRVEAPPDPGSITLAVSGNGGSNWTDLQTYVMNAEDGSQVLQSFDITPYIASDTQIRFKGTVSNVDEVRFYVDNIQIKKD